MTVAREELLEAALDLIAPQKTERARCRQQIIYSASIGPQLIAARKDPTPGEWREEIASYGVAARRFLAATKTLSLRSSAVLLNDSVSGRRLEIGAELEAIITRADQLAHNGGIPAKPSGNRPLDPVASATATWALTLLNEFSDKRPSTTSDGPYHQLTALLYEYVSGCAPVSVERTCDHVLKRSRAIRDKRAAK